MTTKPITHAELRDYELLRNQLESLVDQYGARSLAEHLVEVFYDKAEHMQSVWNDEPASRVWKRAATKLGHTVHYKIDWDLLP